MPHLLGAGNQESFSKMSSGPLIQTMGLAVVISDLVIDSLLQIGVGHDDTAPDAIEGNGQEETCT
jgi:hypothetical protein